MEIENSGSRHLLGRKVLNKRQAVPGAAAVHPARAVRNLLDSSGVRYIYLPPYRNIYPLIHAIYYVDTVEIVEIEKQYKQECV